MKVILPSNTTHEATIEPRFYSSEVLSMDVTKEGNRKVTTQEITYLVVSGVMTITFDLVAVKGDRFSFKIYEVDGDILYRGKLFATEQDPETYKLTKDRYKYSTI